MSPILHWIQPGLTAGSDGKLAVTDPFVANWLPPAPPPRSGPHRYAFYLFKQPASFDGHKYAPANGQSLGLWPRIRYSLDDWAKKAGLSDPIAANYFLIIPAFPNPKRHVHMTRLIECDLSGCGKMHHLNFYFCAMMWSVSSATTLIQPGSGAWSENLADRSHADTLLVELHSLAFTALRGTFGDAIHPLNLYNPFSPATDISHVAEFGNDIFCVIDRERSR
nr:hypothetical protein CFP56_19254 [Quercus suber]